MLLAGKIDFYMGGNLLSAFDAVQQGIPMRVVAADFQKDPQVIMSHPGQGLDKWRGSEERRAVHHAATKARRPSSSGW